MCDERSFVKFFELCRTAQVSVAQLLFVSFRRLIGQRSTVVMPDYLLSAVLLLVCCVWA